MKKILVLLVLSIFANASRLIVLEPSAVEILLALKAKEQIVAIAKPSTLDIYPKEESETLESVGTYIRPSIEKIVSLRPDLVIAGHHSVSVKQDLENFKINTMLLNANTLKDLKENIKSLGKLVDKNEAANELVAKLESDINALKDDELKGKKVLFIFSSNPLMLFCGNNLANDLILELGMSNVCDKKEQTLIVNPEYIIGKNSDYIIYLGTDDAVFLQNPLLKHTKAYKNNKIIKVPSSKILRASPQITLVLEDLKKELLKK